jgi:hypothetical protein
MRRLAPDYRAIAAFRHDNPEAIAASAAFVHFCREQGLIGGRVVAVDGAGRIGWSEGSRSWSVATRRCSSSASPRSAEGRTQKKLMQYGMLRHSLWTGDPGVAIYLWDCIRGGADFPTLDVFFPSATAG